MLRLHLLLRLVLIGHNAQHGVRLQDYFRQREKGRLSAPLQLLVNQVLDGFRDSPLTTGVALRGADADAEALSGFLAGGREAKASKGGAILGWGHFARHGS